MSDSARYNQFRISITAFIDESGELVVETSLTDFNNGIPSLVTMLGCMRLAEMDIMRIASGEDEDD